MRRFCTGGSACATLLLASLSCFGQTAEKFNHAQWTAEFTTPSVAPGGEATAKLTARIDPEWHMYSLTTPPGPIPTTIRTVDSPAVESVTYFEPPPVRKYDPNFKADTETYEGEQTFFARVKIGKSAAAGPLTVTFEPRYQTCSGTSCIPPRTRRISATVNVDPAAQAVAAAMPSGYIEAKPGAGAKAGASGAANEGLAAFLALAFGFGLAAI